MKNKNAKSSRSFLIDIGAGFDLARVANPISTSDIPSTAFFWKEYTKTSAQPNFPTTYDVIIAWESVAVADNDVYKNFWRHINTGADKKLWTFQPGDEVNDSFYYSIESALGKIYPDAVSLAKEGAVNQISSQHKISELSFY